MTVTETKNGFASKSAGVFQPFHQTMWQYTVYCFCLFEKAVGILH